MESVRQLAMDCISAKEVDRKICLSFDCYEKLQAGLLSTTLDKKATAVEIIPGRPAKPTLVNPDRVPKRGFANIESRAALIHAIAHIEFNAINLAWDAVARFKNLPEEYYRDWARIAFEETQHFCMLQEHLKGYGHQYGDFEAHDGLWQMADRTKHDPLVRMALVPRVLEARGLDVTPGLIKKFKNIGDQKTVSILNKIYEDEIGHVEIGSRWFNYFCRQRDLEPRSTFKDLIEQYFPDGLRGPFNLEARQHAGFSSSELDWLETM